MVPRDSISEGAESMGQRIPQTKSEWIEEIAEAYHDAEEAIPFGKFVGKNISEAGEGLSANIFNLVNAVFHFISWRECHILDYLKICKQT